MTEEDTVPWSQYVTAVNASMRRDERLGSIHLLAMEWKERARRLKKDTDPDSLLVALTLEQCAETMIKRSEDYEGTMPIGPISED